MLEPKTKVSTLLGTERCECPTCHEVFSTTNNFDRHRKGAHGSDRHCVDPASVGLVIGVSSKGTYWKKAGDGALNALYAKANSVKI